MSGLSESVERIVVEALAKQAQFTFVDSGEVTREIIEAFADALENGPPAGYYHAARWIRSQIGETE